MSSLAHYYLLSLCAALFAVAVVSALVARQQRDGQRRLQAAALLDALERSTEWVAAQGRAVCFQAPSRPADRSLHDIRAIQRQWFPELDDLDEALSAVHRRLGELLRMHDCLRAHDPEASLDAAYDAAYLALWREHCAIVQSMEQRLLATARAHRPPQRHASPA